jgi:hypothetical protein
MTMTTACIGEGGKGGKSFLLYTSSYPNTTSDVTWPQASSHLILQLWGRDTLSLSDTFLAGGTSEGSMTHPIPLHTVIYFRASGGPVKDRPSFIHSFYGNLPYSRQPTAGMDDIRPVTTGTLLTCLLSLSNFLTCRTYTRRTSGLFRRNFRALQFFSSLSCLQM